MPWLIIPDADIYHEWVDAVTGDTVHVGPDFYQESGTPISDDGNDMEYLHTKVSTSALIQSRDYVSVTDLLVDFYIKCRTLGEKLGEFGDDPKIEEQKDQLMSVMDTLAEYFVPITDSDLSRAEVNEKVEFGLYDRRPGTP